MNITYVSKSLAAASSNGLGSISTAATSVVTLNTSNLDTARRIVFYSTAGSSTVTYTVKGIIEGGGTQTETVIGSSTAGTAATTLWDYQSVTSVSVSSNMNIAAIIGTSSVGGTPWRLTDWDKDPIQLSAAITFSTSNNGMTGQIDITIDDPTSIYDNPFRTVPIPFNSTSPVGTAASTNSIGIVNVDGSAIYPVAAWRLTITSSSSSAGTVYANVMQAGR